MLTSPYEYTEKGETEVASQHFVTFVDLDYTFGKEIKKTERYNIKVGALVATDVQI